MLSISEAKTALKYGAAFFGTIAASMYVTRPLPKPTNQVVINSQHEEAIYFGDQVPIINNRGDEVFHSRLSISQD